MALIEQRFDQLQQNNKQPTIKQHPQRHSNPCPTERLRLASSSLALGLAKAFRRIF
jgi:hypothetical protein